MNNLTHAYLNDLLTIKNHSYNFRYQRKVEVPQVRTVEHDPSHFTSQQPIRSTAAKIWNNLPQDLRDISSFGVSKKNKIKKINKCTERGILFMFILLCWLHFYLYTCLVANYILTYKYDVSISI